MRIFNSTGEKLYQEWVLRFCAKETKGQGAVPFNLLADPTTSVDLGTDTPDPHYPFANKYDFITYLKPYIDACLAKVSQKMDEQRRVWDAFALMFFDTICPKDETGAYAPKKFERYMVIDKRRNQCGLSYRHLVLGPYQLSACNVALVKPFFEATAPCVFSDFEEQIGSRQELVGNPNFLSLLYLLYTVNGHQMKGFDVKAVPIDKERPKWVKKCKSGSLRRLVSVAYQLKNNYDILHCSKDQMLELLGVEFKDWIERKGQQ